jgi:hypothetical protein
MLGVRPIGVTVSMFTLIGSITMLILSFHGVMVWRLGFALIAFLALSLSIFWLRVVNRDWVRSAAECYAERLIESLDTLMPLSVDQAPPNAGSGN